MQVIRRRAPAPFDVDDSLVMHLPVEQHQGYRTIKVPDEIEGKVVTLVVNEPMVRLLKEEASRNRLVIVWSRGGELWAEAVVKALKLEKYVDLVMEKPLVYYDDKDVKDWLQYRVYLPHTQLYKNKG